MKWKIYFYNFFFEKYRNKKDAEAYGLRQLATGHAQGEAQGPRRQAIETTQEEPSGLPPRTCQAKASNRPARRQEGQGGQHRLLDGRWRKGVAARKEARARKKTAREDDRESEELRIFTHKRE